MKKILLALFFAVGSLGCWAKGHFEFAGVEMDGNINTFVKKLEKKGFRTLKTLRDGHLVAMYGTYANVDFSQIYIFSTDGENVVYKIGIYMPSKNSWSELKSQYMTYRELLVDKYGKPNSDYMEFSGGYADGDGRELEALYKEQCSFFAYWGSELGEVNIGMNEDGADKGQIVTIYKDAANLKLQEAYEARQKKTE